MPGPVYGLQFVHRAIQNGLSEISEEFSELSESFSNEKTKVLQSKLEILGKLITLHADSEDAALFPALEEKQQGITDSYFEDHKGEKLKLQLLEENIEQLLSTGTLDSSLLRDLKTKSSLYKESLVSHMEKEERELWPLMDQYYSAPEQLPIMGKIGAFFKPEDLAELVPWIVMNLDSNSRASYIQLIKTAFPAPVFEMAKGWLQTGVSPEVWQSIESKVTG
ncbi:MAG: hemerythrin domain-containing protein [SAR324 cluster bacterium]|nr:hemerythrin domain-containing protein [SAR324 cluster bacterium]